MRTPKVTVTVMALPDVMRPRGQDVSYRVVRITNALQPRPNDLMTETEVQTLIDQGWTVTVIPFGVRR